MPPLLPSRAESRAKARAERLLVPHLHALYRLAYGWTGDPHDAEDLVQALVTKLLAQLDTLEATEDARPWLARSLYNLFVDQTRRRSVSPLHRVDVNAEPTLLDEIEDDTGDSPERFAERALTQAHLARALMRLTPELRAVLVWHDIEGYTLEELARAQGVAEGTFKSRLHRARGQMRAMLIERFPDRVRGDDQG